MQLAQLMDATSYSLDYYQWHRLKFMTLPSSQKYTCPTPHTQDWQGVSTYYLKGVQDTNTPITCTLLGLILCCFSLQFSQFWFISVSLEIEFQTKTQQPEIATNSVTSSSLFTISAYTS